MEQKENDVKRGVETLDRNSIIARNLWGGLEEAVTIPPREEGALLPGTEAPIELGRGGATGEKAVTPPGEKESVLSKEANEVTRKDQITQTQSQLELSVEELFQQVREREIKLLLRAGFPDANSNEQSQSYAAEKQTAVYGKENSRLVKDEDSAESRTRRRSLCFPCCNRNRAENDEQEEKIPCGLAENKTIDNEVCPSSFEMNQEDSIESFTGPMYLCCFPCLYRNRAQRIKEKAEERPGLFTRIRKFFSRTNQRRRQ